MSNVNASELAFLKVQYPGKLTSTPDMESNRGYPLPDSQPCMGCFLGVLAHHCIDDPVANETPPVPPMDFRVPYLRSVRTTSASTFRKNLITGTVLLGVFFYDMKTPHIP
ncbi:MAG: hypothetical protein ABR999_02200 [Methanoregula sp.]|jgi:hypothetical protein|uniref:hypothetical protein n=1 Tax=Methanoregula sp. TaxID=2052170 RepID=UPI003D140466